MIEVELGATIPTTQYGNIRPSIKISVDPDSTVAVSDQIDRGIEIANQIFAKIDENIIAWVDTAASAASEIPKQIDRIDKIDKALKQVIAQLKTR